MYRRRCWEWLAWEENGKWDSDVTPAIGCEIVQGCSTGNVAEEGIILQSCISSPALEADNGLFPEEGLQLIVYSSHITSDKEGL